MALNNEGFSIEITADTKSFNQKLEQARRNLEKFKREAGSVMINGGAGGTTTGGNTSLTIQRRFNASISAMSTAVDAATRSVMRFSSALTSAAIKPRAVTPATAAEGAAVARSGGGMTLLPSALMLAAGAGVPLYKGFAEFSAREKLRVDLGTLLRDDARGADMASRITKYAAATPYGQNDLAGTVKTLLQYGANENEAEKYMKQIGDVALGNKNQMNSLGLVLGQVKSAGALKGQDLLQFINAGWNPLATLSEMTGQSIGELKEAASQGAVTFEHVAAALEKATSEGGQFYKGAERGSKTLAGIWSTLQDKIATALSEIVGSGEGTIKNLMETWINQDWSGIIQSGAQAFQNIAGIFSKMAGVFGVIVRNADKLVVAIEAIAALSVSRHVLDLANNVRTLYANAQIANAGLNTFGEKLKFIGKTSIVQAGLIAAASWASMKIVEAASATYEWAKSYMIQSKKASAAGEHNQARNFQASYAKDRVDLEKSMTAADWDLVKKMGAVRPDKPAAYNESDPKAVKWYKYKSAELYYENQAKAAQREMNGYNDTPFKRPDFYKDIKDAQAEIDKAMKSEGKFNTPIIVDKSKKEVHQTNNIKVDESRFAKVVRDNLEMLLTSHFRIDRDLIATQAGA